MGARRFAPCEILNWADGRCLRAAVYIYFILGGMNSASNTFFWWKAALFLCVNLKSFRQILSMCTFQRLPLILDQVIVFFLFYKYPNGPPLQSVCDCLKGHSAIQSSLKCLTSDLRTRTDSRGQRPTPEEKPESLKWSARRRMFDLTPQHHHTAATNTPAGWESFTHSSVRGANHLLQTTSLMSRWWVLRRWHQWILISFLTREQTCIMALWCSGLKIVVSCWKQWFLQTQTIKMRRNSQCIPGKASPPLTKHTC